MSINQMMCDIDHLSKEISKIYDILISLTERVDRIEEVLVCKDCVKHTDKE